MKRLNSIVLFLLFSVSVTLFIRELLPDNSDLIQLNLNCEGSDTFRPALALSTICPLDETVDATIQSEYFLARHSGLQFGYVGSGSHMQAYLETVDSQQHSIALVDQLAPAFKNIRIPTELEDQKIRLVVNDNSSVHSLSISGLKNDFYLKRIIKSLILIAMFILVLHLVAISIAVIVMRWLPLESTTIVLPIIIGIFGYLAFIGAIINLGVLLLVSVTFFLLSIFGCLSCFAQRQNLAVQQCNNLLAPVALYTLLVVVIGYYPLQLDQFSTNNISATRWRDLPADNWVPKIFADQLWAGFVKTPMFSDWLSSDRPPLQTGINLLAYPLVRTGVSYQLISSYLQALIILPVFVLVRELGLNKMQFWVVLGMLTSSLLIVNTLFVWPKLVSATFVLIVYILLITEQSRKYSSKFVITTTGVATAMAMLSHGGAIFPLIAIYTVALFTSLKNTRLHLTVSGLLSIFLYVPWMMYQKYIDPPGNRIAKWHLAGDTGVNDLSTWSAIQNAYQHLSFQSWFDGRLVNFETLFSYWNVIHQWVVIALSPALSGKQIDAFHDQGFFFLFNSLWFFSPIFIMPIFLLIAILNKHVSPEAIKLFVVVTFCTIIWSILIFMPGSTSIHHGSYFLWIGLYIYSCFMLSYINNKILVIACVTNVFFFLRFYVFDVVTRNVINEKAYIIIVGIIFLCLVVSLILARKSSMTRVEPSGIQRVKLGDLKEAD